MKFFAIALCIALFAVAQCQDNGNGAPLTKDDILDLIKLNNPDIQCINLECRFNCHQEGFRTGFCTTAGDCNCAGPLIAA
ncbi:unnamed protein product [Phyllotreta striolata]|uniref:Uncharacterized protein n=1 Tax=Phyllotreta striolata TaxID=444603 RepID=A0A9N9TLN7_PHYSR|nr:unnamed protein product [Phyllotreta striolata]